MEVVLRLLLAYVFCWSFVPIAIFIFSFAPTIGAFLGVVASYELARKMVG